MALRKEDVFVVTKQVLVDAADSIREKTEDPDLIKISDFDDEIDSIPTGGSIEENLFLNSLDNDSSVILDSYEIPSTITKISKDCRNFKVKEVTGDGVTIVEPNFLYSNTSIERVSFPNVKQIKDSFLRESNVKYVNCPSLNQIYNYVIRSCPEVLEVFLGGTLNLFGNQNIRDCPKLVKCVIPGLSNTGDGFLLNCPLIENLSLPRAGGTIKNSIQDCSSLKNLFLPGDTIWTISSSNAFNNTPLKALAQDAHIWVNDNLVDSYKAANNWSAMSTIITRISDYTGDFNYMEGVVTS